MTRFVADASICLAWVFPYETDRYAEGVLESLSSCRMLVPAHWSLEITNALAMAERRRRIGPADTSRATALLGGLPIDFDLRTAERAVTETLGLARTHSLTTYDAAYLELCLREALPLATLDRDLIAACRLTGVAIYQPA